MITKIELEKLAEKYETGDFIKDDPVQFPHRFNRPEDIEIAAFISSIFAFGSRKVFIKKLEQLFKIMQDKPLEYILNFDPKTLKGFNYRFAKDFDVIEVFLILNKLYKEDQGLKALFEYGYNNTPHPASSHLLPHGEKELLTSPLVGEVIFQHEERMLEKLVRGKILPMLQTVTDYFYSNVKNEVGMGFYHLIPNPKNGGAMKRMNMFLRWMVRKPPVDLGIWNFIPTSELLIPLDTHVSRLSREMGLLKTNTDNFKAVLELTNNLKKFDPQDPIKFDFAMFGLGIDINQD